MTATALPVRTNRPCEKTHYRELSAHLDVMCSRMTFLSARMWVNVPIHAVRVCRCVHLAVCQYTRDVCGLYVWDSVKGGKCVHLVVGIP